MIQTRYTQEACSQDRTESCSHNPQSGRRNAASITATSTSDFKRLPSRRDEVFSPRLAVAAPAPFPQCGSRRRFDAWLLGAAAAERGVFVVAFPSDAAISAHSPDAGVASFFFSNLRAEASRSRTRATPAAVASVPARAARGRDDGCCPRRGKSEH